MKCQVKEDEVGQSLELVQITSLKKPTRKTIRKKENFKFFAVLGGEKNAK